jgi:hypothetical protein
MDTKGDGQRISAVLTIERTVVSDNVRPAERPTRKLLLTGLSLLMVAAPLCGWADLTRGGWRRQAVAGDIHQIANTQRKGWKLVGAGEGIYGQEQFVLVEEASESNPKLYTDVIEHLCRKNQWCGLDFWSNPALIPSQLPMSDQQIASEVANYTQNPAASFVQFVWNCHVHNDPLNCFSYW